MGKSSLTWIVVWLVAAQGSAVASTLTAHKSSPLTIKCLQQASAQYAVHPAILLAILMVEGGTVGRSSQPNRNGTYDIGPFQINSIHLPELARLGVSEAALRNDGCLNASVAARHLRRVLTPGVLARIQDEESYMRALARYHSASPEKNAAYAEKLREAFFELKRHGALD